MNTLTLFMTDVETTSFMDNAKDFLHIFTDNYQLFVEGIIATLELALFGTLFGLLFGALLGAVLSVNVHYKDNALVKFFKNFLKAIVNIYVALFRGTPMMVQAMILYFGVFANSAFDISALVAGIIIISLNTAAYISQIIIGGINAIEKGQLEAARSLGLTYSQAMVKVIIPQAIKDTLPSLANMLILNIKDTSVLNVITVAELFSAAQSVYTTTYNVQAYTWAAIIYLILTLTLTLLLKFIFKEKKTHVLDSGVEYETV